MSSTIGGRLRIAAWLGGGVLIAAALGAGAAAMADEVRGSGVRPTSSAAPASTPEATAVPASPPAAIAQVIDPPSQTPTTAPPPAVPMDLHSIKPWVSLNVTVPSGIAHCPAGTVPLRAMRATVGGVEYSLPGEANHVFTDLTGDGRDELVLTLDCGPRGRAMLVLGATGPTTFATLAARDLGGIAHVERLTATTHTAAAHSVVTTFDAGRTELAWDIRTWTLREGRIVQLSAPPKQVDWPNATITMPAIGACAAGPYTFVDGTAVAGSAGTGTAGVAIAAGGAAAAGTAAGTAAADGAGKSLRIHPEAVKYHFDADQDGRRDTVLQFDCRVGAAASGQAVVALTGTGAATGRVLGAVLTATGGDEIVGYDVTKDVVELAVAHTEAGKRITRHPGFHWSSGGFAPIG